MRCSETQMVVEPFSQLMIGWLEKIILRWHDSQKQNFFLKLILICILQVGVQAVLSILLATFAGFGVAMSGCSILVEFLRWKQRWEARSNQQHPVLFPAPLQTAHRDRYQADVENPETLSGGWVIVYLVYANLKSAMHKFILSLR